MTTIGARTVATRGNDSDDDSWPLTLRTFDGFYRDHYRSVLQTAVALTRDVAAAEDLTQDAFLAARDSWDRVGGYDRPDLWVRRVVSNRSVSRFRRLTREAAALGRLRRERPLSAEIGVPADEVWQAIASLPRRQAQVVVMVVIQDLPVDDAAAVLGCGAETVRTHLRRGRARLAHLLREEDTP